MYVLCMCYAGMSCMCYVCMSCMCYVGMSCMCYVCMSCMCYACMLCMFMHVCHVCLCLYVKYVYACMSCTFMHVCYVCLCMYAGRELCTKEGGWDLTTCTPACDGACEIVNKFKCPWMQPSWLKRLVSPTSQVGFTYAVYLRHLQCRCQVSNVA